MNFLKNYLITFCKFWEISGDATPFPVEFAHGGVCTCLGQQCIVDIRCNHYKSWSSDNWIRVEAFIEKLVKQHEKKKKRKGQPKSFTFFFSFFFRLIVHLLLC